jgi:tetratricopeptide (TPR) repeat protein
MSHYSQGNIWSVQVADDRALYRDALKKGGAYLDRSLWKEAFGAYRSAATMFPKEAEPYAGLGEACFGMKRLDKALELYKMAARYSRGNISYLRKVADIQERLGQLSAAGRTYMALGEVYLRRRKLDDAVSQWQRAIRLEPNLLGTHKRLAMVYQRQNNSRDAVREYLAIARILQMQGQRDKAIRMCQAALRLDPDNKDVIRAFELIRGGPDAYVEEEEEVEEITEAAPVEEGDEVTGLVRQMADAFEAEIEPAQPGQTGPSTPLEAARRLAQNQLAEEIFRDEDENEPEGKLSKLERDALIGQGMDFELRGQLDDAITCYEKAIDGGLQMSAAYFTLGLLYLNRGNQDKARQTLTIASRDPAFRSASEAVIRTA